MCGVHQITTILKNHRLSDDRFSQAPIIFYFTFVILIAQFYLYSLLVVDINDSQFRSEPFFQLSEGREPLRLIEKLGLSSHDFD